MENVRAWTLNSKRVLSSSKTFLKCVQKTQVTILPGRLVDLLGRSGARQAHVTGRHASRARAWRKWPLRWLSGGFVGHGMALCFSGNDDIIATPGAGRCRRKPTAGQKRNDRSGPPACQGQRRK